MDIPTPAAMMIRRRLERRARFFLSLSVHARSRNSRDVSLIAPAPSKYASWPP